MYSTLAMHPQTKMPPMKELRYFWERVFLGNCNLLYRLCSPHWHFSQTRKFFWRCLRHHCLNRRTERMNLDVMKWAMRYLFYPRTDAWYRELFDREHVSGDVSPNYSELPDQEVARIARLFPQVKIIISLRNPVDRTWSYAKMVLCKDQDKSLQEVREEKFIACFSLDVCFQTSQYVSLIKRWKQYFPCSQILILFFDDLLINPVSYYEGLCHFLQLNSPDATLKQAVNPIRNQGIEATIPLRLGQYLYQLYEPSILALIDYLPESPYPRQWLTELRDRYHPGHGVHGDSKGNNPQGSGGSGDGNFRP